MPAGEAFTKPKKGKYLKTHILIVRNNDNKCETCNKSFSCPQILHSHIVNILLTIKFKSDLCFEYFVHPSILKNTFKKNMVQMNHGIKIYNVKFVTKFLL